MPHKRAKQPVREREKAQRATDLAPKISIEHEPIPKSVSRVLDAGQIRREYRKRQQLDAANDSDEDTLQRKRERHNTTDGGERTALRIKPGETVTQFNRRERVENSMMPVIKTALRQSSAQERRVRREEVAQQTLKRGKQGDKARHPLLASPKKRPDPPPTVATDREIVYPRSAGKEFQVVSTSAPRRLNDVAQEPPVIKKLPRGATKNDAAPLGVLSMAQKAMMEEERERAIRHYRELKARKLRESGDVKLDG